MFNHRWRVAFIGNALPRQCGIATFTTDLEQAVSALDDVAGTAIFPMRDPGRDYDWSKAVRQHIDQDDPASYLAAAEAINTGGFDVACLQHEFGIFGGDAGDLILDLISALNIPLVSTLHTVLDSPDANQRRVMMAILAASARVVVMAAKGRDILIDSYGADPEKIAIIPHGIPDAPFESSDAARLRLGFAGRQIILTFGLISPNKGIETMIEAMPAIIIAAPDALYVVMGATHPHLLRDAGEAYRDGLIARAAALGVEDHVLFLNRFVERPELLDHIAACDVYVTPYLGAAQLTSGTLAYSHGLGRPVVSTPYWHAAELLGDGSGVLIPFGDVTRLGAAVAALLCDETARLAMGLKAYAASRSTIWSAIGARYLTCFRAACHSRVLSVIRGCDMAQAVPPIDAALPATSNRHFIAMCDDTGIFQHAVYTIPDRHHGYCVDDNARALLLCCVPHNDLEPELEEALTARFASFVQDAWNPDNQRFRNFMGFNRTWLEPAGSQDSHGRTLWSLGQCALARAGTSLGAWAARLFAAALPTVADFTAPRSWAFTLLGLDAYCRACPQDRRAFAMRVTLANRLAHLLVITETRERVWFEDRLTYDNARLCEALIRTGTATKASHLIDGGLRSLRWLMEVQTAPLGHFRPVGSEGFLLTRKTPLAFDQQPLEATATIAACVAAHAVEPDAGWRGVAAMAFGWFMGQNDLAISLVDVDTGMCRDGLHPDRANENSGAESVLSYLLALADMHGFGHTQIPDLARAMAGNDDV